MLEAPPGVGYADPDIDEAMEDMIGRKLACDTTDCSPVPDVECKAGCLDCGRRWKCLGGRKLVVGTFNDSDEIHGPVVTWNIYSNIDHGIGDQVSCLHSLQWPPCASVFITRPRHHGWPSQSLIDKTRQAGCHVVPVGNPQSEYKDLEWRWSFSVAEKELIHDMNETIFTCYYLLKAIKKKHWTEDDPEQPTTFCSYFIKTACLWVGESNQQDGINVVKLCTKVIDWLMSCYHINRLPHYFVPDQLLIGHLSGDMRKEVIDWLESIKAGLPWLIQLQLQFIYLYCARMNRHGYHWTPEYMLK